MCVHCGMRMPGLLKPTRTAYFLATLLFCLLFVPLFCAITMLVIEQSSLLPDGFWDKANDFTCTLILTLSGSTGTGRLGFFILFFPVPIAITLYRRAWLKAVAFIICASLPSILEAIFTHGYYYTSLVWLLLFLLMPPFLIPTWASLTRDPLEKRLIWANLQTVALTLFAADIVWGIGIHGGYCK